MSLRESKVNLLFFTPREREILKLIAEGYKEEEIADELYISAKTVETHLVNLMGKSNLHNISSVINYALEKGLISIYEILESRFSKRKLEAN